MRKRTGKIALLSLALLLSGVSVAPAADAKPPAKEETRKDRFDDPLPADALARLGTVRWRQGTPIVLLTFLPDSKQVLTVGTDLYVRIWDAETGRLERSFNASGQTGPLDTGGVPEWMYNPGQQFAAVSGDGKRVATASQRDRKVRVWDTKNGKMLQEVASLQNGLTSLAFTSDGKQLATSSYDGSISLVDAETGKVAKTWNRPDGGNRVWYGGMNGSAFTGDGKMLVTMGTDVENQQAFPSLKIWDVAAGKLLHSIRNPQNLYGFYSPSFSPDGKTLAWGTSDGSVRLVDPATAKEVTKITPAQRRGGMMQLTFSPDGKKLYTKSQGESGFREYDAKTGKEVRQLGDVAYKVQRNVYYNQAGNTLSVSPDGKRIIGVGGNNALYMVDLTKGKEVPITSAGHDSPVLDVQYAEGGKTLITRGLDGSMRRWEAATGKDLGQVKLPGQAQNLPAYMQTLSPDGKFLATANYDGTVQIIDAASGKQLHSVTINQQQRGYMSRLAFSPDSKMLAARSQMDNQVTLISVATGKEIRKLVPVNNTPPNQNYYYGNQWQFLLFSGDGKYVAAAGTNQDNSIRIWDVASGNEMKQLTFPQGQFVTSGTFSLDGRTLALEMSDTTLGIWEVQTGKERRRFGQATQNRNPNGYNPYGIQAGSTLAYSGDGTLLALAGKDRKVRVWETATGKELGTFEGHEGSILALAFAPDGKTLTTSASDTTALVWDMSRREKNRTPQTASLTADELDARWKLLDSTDSVKAADALAALWAAPKSSIPFLADHVKPAPPTEVDRVEQLIRDLDNSRFVVRRKALEDLERMGDVAAPHLQKTLEGTPSVEVKKRVTELLERLVVRSLTADELRGLRIVELLEKINTPEAKDLLHQLAKGAPSALLTVEAQAALSRMK